jgi:hypothetical protein
METTLLSSPSTTRYFKSAMFGAMPKVGWAKFSALAEGARIASRRLWPR